jgi:hypothetical protein
LNSTFGFRIILAPNPLLVALLRVFVSRGVTMVLKISYLQAMEGEGKSGGGNTQWTASELSFVQTYLANLVSEGKKTSTGFKKVHVNLCAKALNDHFKITRTAD